MGRADIPGESRTRPLLASLHCVHKLAGCGVQRLRAALRPVLWPACIYHWEAPLQELAVEVIALFAGECLTTAELRGVIDRSFETFTVADIVPVVAVGGYHVAELFHGPTLAFKDFGQQVLCKLLDFFASRAGTVSTLVVSTTGDTGPAAIHGCLGKQAFPVGSPSILAVYP
jgi:threonine synthase